MANKVRVNMGNGATAEFPNAELIPVELQGYPYDVVPIVEPTLEEIALEKTPLYIERIARNVNSLTTRALSSSMGKQGTRSYLESQKMIYQEKYSVAKGITVNASMVQTITDEMNRDYPNESDLDALLVSYGITPNGTKLQKFCEFIVFRYEYGANIYGVFISLIEDFRTCALTHIEKMQFDKAEIINVMAENLPIQISQQQLSDLRSEMLAV
jgi:hypothetical protein